MSLSKRNMVVSMLGALGLGGIGHAITPQVVTRSQVAARGSDQWPHFLHTTGMHNGRGHGGKKQAHRHTGIRAQKRAARKARNRARA